MTHSVSAKLMGNSRRQENWCEIKALSAVRDDIARHLMNDKGCHSTTLVDYYALPQTSQKAWSGRATANELPHDDKAHTVQDATLEDLAQNLGKAKIEVHLIPYQYYLGSNNQQICTPYYFIFEIFKSQHSIKH